MKLLISPAALQDIKDIKQYISVDLCSPTAAERTVRRIISAYTNLLNQPFIGAQLSAKINIDSQFRYLISGNYLIFYQVNQDIEIHRIIYGRRDYIKILFDIAEDIEDLPEDAND